MENTKKIKLLIAVPALECGGMEKYTALLCNSINTNLFDVVLVVLNNENPFFKIINTQVTVINLNIKNVRYSIFKLLNVIKKIKPNIVYCTGNHLNLYLAIFRKLLGKNILLVARETSIVQYNNKRAKLPWLYDKLVKIFYCKIDFLISQSYSMQNDLIKNYNINPKKATVIYNPIVYNNSIKKIEKTEEDAPKIFITVARLSEEKGIDRLIASVAHLTFAYQYYIIGDGKLKQALQNQINTLNLQNKVFLVGRKNNPFNEFAQVDLFFMGSRYEGLGNVLLEATSYGIPIVAFNSPGGIAEVVQDGVNGFLVEDGNETAFANTIEKAINYNFDRQNILDTTVQRFSSEKIIPQTEQLFISLCN